LGVKLPVISLLPDLEKKQNDEKDLTHIKKEIEFLYGTQGD
jgi:hypothetical protein